MEPLTRQKLVLFTQRLRSTSVMVLEAGPRRRWIEALEHVIAQPTATPDGLLQSTRLLCEAVDELGIETRFGTPFMCILFSLMRDCRRAAGRMPIDTTGGLMALNVAQTIDDRFTRFRRALEGVFHANKARQRSLRAHIAAPPSLPPCGAVAVVVPSLVAPTRPMVLCSPFEAERASPLRLVSATDVRMYPWAPPQRPAVAPMRPPSRSPSPQPLPPPGDEAPLSDRELDAFVASLWEDGGGEGGQQKEEQKEGGWPALS